MQEGGDYGKLVYEAQSANCYRGIGQLFDTEELRNKMLMGGILQVGVKVMGERVFLGKLYLSIYSHFLLLSKNHLMLILVIAKAHSFLTSAYKS